MTRLLHKTHQVRIAVEHGMVILEQAGNGQRIVVAPEQVDDLVRKLSQATTEVAAARFIKKQD